jgi:hypothetical protein
MRPSLKVGIGLCALAGALSLSAAANADPYYHRYNDGSWTNAEFNDGSCHFYYSHNSYDNQTNVNRYGDCSQIAVGPNGEAVQLNAMPMVPPPY